MNSLTALMHNYHLIQQAEKVIKDMANNPNCYLYLKNPDGTRIRIQPGCEIESYEICPIVKEEEL